jgi:hypothetical protein
MADWLGNLGDHLVPFFEILYVLGGAVVALAILVFAVRYLIGVFV